ncbi:unnamed protein product [Staurois parvus]|uniref:Uncharacterized protein n=1 Tax=Staurois parvus TaxID=386267 RepID=A0ABN9EWL6_9NEOB|nr:unnamed protein product [Staurois parvus]
MDNDRWHRWGYTDHQGTLIIMSPLRNAGAVSVTAREERNAENLHFPIYMRSAVIGHS